LAHTILAIIGDTQIGSSTALAPPTFEIHTENKKETQLVHYNLLGSWLWENWVDYWNYVKVLAGIRGKHRKNRIIVMHMGDVIDGNHHGTLQIIQSVADQIKVAIDVLRPIIDMADASYGIIGTEAHAGKSGVDEKAIDDALGVNDYAQTMMLEIDGKVHDFAHHGRIGQRDWTSQAASQAVEVAMDCAKFGIKAPDYIWRAHNHVIDDTGDKFDFTRVICMPSWQLKTAFTYRIAANRQYSDIGGYIVNNGVVDSSRNRYKAQPDARKVIHP